MPLKEQCVQQVLMQTSVHKNSFKRNVLTLRSQISSLQSREKARDDAVRKCKTSRGNMPLRKADIMIPNGSYTKIMVIHQRNVEEAMQRRSQEIEPVMQFCEIKISQV
jgi:hypothetical protein